MVLWQNIQSGATAKASVVQVGAAGSKGGAGRDEFRSDHFARCQQRNARRICPDILRRGAANGMLQCQRGVRGKKRLCDGTGGWAGGGQHLRRGGQGSVLRRRSIDHQQGSGKTVKGGFFIAGGGHGQHVGTTGHLGFKLPVPAQQFRQGGAGQPGSSTVDEDLAGIVGKKAGVGRNIIHPMAEHAQAVQWAHSAAEPLQAGTPGGKPGIAVFGQQAGAAVQAGH